MHVVQTKKEEFQVCMQSQNPDICWRNNTEWFQQLWRFSRVHWYKFLTWVIGDLIRKDISLDLLLTRKKKLVIDVKVRDNLGCNDHKMLGFMILLELMRRKQDKKQHCTAGFWKSRLTSSRICLPNNVLYVITTLQAFRHSHVNIRFFRKNWPRVAHNPVIGEYFLDFWRKHWICKQISLHLCFKVRECSDMNKYQHIQTNTAVILHPRTPEPSRRLNICAMPLLLAFRPFIKTLFWSTAYKDTPRVKHSCVFCCLSHWLVQAYCFLKILCASVLIFFFIIIFDACIVGSSKQENCSYLSVLLFWFLFCVCVGDICLLIILKQSCLDSVTVQ